MYVEDSLNHCKLFYVALLNWFVLGYSSTFTSTEKTTLFVCVSEIVCYLWQPLGNPMEMNPMVNPIKTDSISVFDLFIVVFTKIWRVGV